MAKKNTAAAAAKTNPIEAALNDVREAIAKNDAKVYTVTLLHLKDEVKDANLETQRRIFAECAKSEKPFVAFVEAMEYDCKKVVEERDKETGVVTDVKVADAKGCLSLYGFVDRTKVGTGSIAAIETLRVLYIYALRDELIKIAPDALKKVEDTGVVKKAVAEEKVGRTPTSNRQFEMRIKKILEMMGLDYQPKKEDVVFLGACMFKRGRGKCSIAANNKTQFIRSFCEVLRHFVLGLGYDVIEKNLAARPDALDEE